SKGRPRSPPSDDSPAGLRPIVQPGCRPARGARARRRMARQVAHPAGHSRTSYQISFNPSWLIRPSLADVRRPKAGFVMFVSTPTKFGWLNPLNDSSRNCKRAPLARSKFLKSARSRLLMVGARSMLRVELPNWPSAGWGNALVLNHFSIVPPPELGSPETFARFVPKLSKTLPRSAARIVIGNQCCQL